MRNLSIVALLLIAACFAPAAQASHELGVRAGGMDDFYVGGEWQTPLNVGPAIFVPSLDFSFGDFDAVTLNADLRWDLLPLFDTGIVFYGKAGPTLLFSDNHDDIGLSLTIGADIGFRQGRSLHVEWRFGFGDIPDEKLGVALMFKL